MSELYELSISRNHAANPSLSRQNGRDCQPDQRFGLSDMATGGIVIITLQHGSALDPRQYPLGSAALILCDPPFKPSREQSAYKQIRSENDHQMKSILTPMNSEYDTWWDAFCQLALAQLAKAGYFCFKADDYTAREVYPITQKYFKWVYTIIWDKGCIGLGRKFRKRHEIIEVYVHKDATELYWNQAKGVIKKFHGGTQHLAFQSVLEVFKGNNGILGKQTAETHINQTPPALWIPFLKYMCPNWGLVLDPFMGSGSVGIACRDLGFNYHGIEIDEEFFKIAESALRPRTMLTNLLYPDHQTKSEEGL